MIGFQRSAALTDDVDLRLWTYSGKRWQVRNGMNPPWTLRSGSCENWAHGRLWIQMIFSYSFHFFFLDEITIFEQRESVKWTQSFSIFAGSSNSASNFLLTFWTPPSIGLKNKRSIIYLVGRNWMLKFSCVAAFIWSSNFRMTFAFIPVLWVSQLFPRVGLHCTNFKASKLPTHHLSRRTVLHT